MAGVLSLSEDALTDMITPEGHNGVTWTENRLKAMPQSFDNNTCDETLNLVELESRLLRKIKEVTELR